MGYSPVRAAKVQRPERGVDLHLPLLRSAALAAPATGSAAEWGRKKKRSAQRSRTTSLARNACNLTLAKHKPQILRHISGNALNGLRDTTPVSDFDRTCKMRRCAWCKLKNFGEPTAVQHCQMPRVVPAGKTKLMFGRAHEPFTCVHPAKKLGVFPHVQFQGGLWFALTNLGYIRTRKK